jgi:fermentation-respiration switch protein FrsA (DUF1100 family)
VRTLLHIAAVVLIGYGGLLGLVYVFQSRLIYFPGIAGISSGATPADMGLRYEEVWLRSSDDLRLHAWFIPADRARATLLFFHGNAGNISHRLDSIAIFQQLRLAVFILDYRGYGHSEGRPGEDGTYRDAEAAWRYLTLERNLPPGEIVIFGRSLGAAIAAWLAARVQPAALIIESAFTSVADVAAKYYWFLPVRALARYRYDTLTYLSEVSCPLLVVHSAQDEIIPVEHGKRLFAAAREPKAYLELRGGHNDGFFVSRSIYTQGMDAFLNQYLNE